MKTTILLFVLAFPFLVIAQTNQPTKNTIMLEGGSVLFGKGDYQGFGTAVIYTRDLSKWLDFNVGSGVSHASNFSSPIDRFGDYSVTVFYSLLGIGIKPIRVGEKFALKVEGGLAPNYASSIRDNSRTEFITKEGKSITIINQKTNIGLYMSYYVSTKFQLTLDRYHLATGIRIIGDPEYSSFFYAQMGLRF